MKHNTFVVLRGKLRALNACMREEGPKSMTSGFTVRNQKKGKPDPKQQKKDNNKEQKSMKQKNQ